MEKTKNLYFVIEQELEVGSCYDALSATLSLVSSLFLHPAQYCSSIFSSINKYDIIFCFIYLTKFSKECKMALSLGSSVNVNQRDMLLYKYISQSLMEYTSTFSQAQLLCIQKC